MIFGMPAEAFTRFHVGLSLVGILSGLVVLAAMTANRYPRGVTALFLAATIGADVTGFMFPGGLDPARVVGMISLIALALALMALYRRRFAGRWRLVYVITATLAVYLNVFVAVAQAFQKLTPLYILAPTGTEPPFLAAQGMVLIAFGALGYLAARRFRPAI